MIALAAALPLSMQAAPGGSPPSSAPPVNGDVGSTATTPVRVSQPKYRNL